MKHKRKILFVWTVLGGLLVIRVLVYFLSPRPIYTAGQQINSTVLLDQEPEARGASNLVRSGNLQIYFPLSTELHFGDQVQFSGKLTCAHKQPQCEIGEIFQPKIITTLHKGLGPIEDAALTIKYSIIRQYNISLNRTQAALLSGIVFGSAGLNSSFKNKIASVGLSHVIAASGMNVTLVSGFVLILLSRLPLHRRFIVFLALIAVLFYITMTGFQPSIVRAAIMAGFVLIASLFGRPNASWSGLILAALVMLILSPELIISTSFLLSFTAMTSQIIISNWKPMVPDIALPFVELSAQTVAAIVFTLPITVLIFSQFSSISTISNLLTLWTVEPLMILGLIAGIIGLVVPGLASLILVPTSVLLDYFLGIVNLLSKDNLFLITTPQLNVAIPIGYYLILIFLIWWWKQRSAKNYEPSVA